MTDHELQLKAVRLRQPTRVTIMAGVFGNYFEWEVKHHEKPQE
jgi:hypothetical protein